MTVAAMSVCALCGMEQPLALAVCIDCGGITPDVADTLVFVRPSRDPRERERMNATLDMLLPPDTDHDPDALVARGHRALLQVPATMASAVLERLRSLGVLATTRPRRWAIASPPHAFTILLVAVAAVGFYAGAVAVPVLLWTTPFVTGLLFFGAQAHLTKPAIRSQSGPRFLSVRVHRAVIDGIALLPVGNARDRLASLVRSSESVLRWARAAARTEIVRDVERLMDVASVAALHLAELDASLAALDGTSHAKRVATLQADLTDRFRSAQHVLRRLQAEAVDDDPIHEELSSLVDELDSDSRVYAQATRDVERLLAR